MYKYLISLAHYAKNGHHECYIIYILSLNRYFWFTNA